MTKPVRHPDLHHSQPHFPQEGEPGLETQLRAALATPQVAAHLATRGQRLLERLTRPVQVLVVGPAESGKSAVVDMLLGAQVAGRVTGLAMVEFAHGEDPKAFFEDVTGKSLPQPGYLGDYAVPSGCVSGRQLLPHPLLKSISLTEVTLTGDAAQQRAILTHAVEYGDVILCCSQGFDAAEQSLWATVPERKRDSGFLVLTQADQLIMRATLQETVTRLSPIVEQSFLGLYPVAALQGLQAKEGAAEGDKHLWRASGGQRLAEDLRRRVAQGRAATQDQVEALLWQLSLQVDHNTGPIPAAPEPTALPTSPTVNVIDAASADDHGFDGGSAVLAQALAQLQGQAEAMLNDAGDSPKSAAVLDHCLLAVREMAETLLTTSSDTPHLHAARNASEEGEEMLMLLQLEQDEDAAVDAVTLLLQLKKELSDPLAHSVAEGAS